MFSLSSYFSEQDEVGLPYFVKFSNYTLKQVHWDNGKKGRGGIGT